MEKSSEELFPLAHKSFAAQLALMFHELLLYPTAALYMVHGFIIVLFFLSFPFSAEEKSALRLAIREPIK